MATVPAAQTANVPGRVRGFLSGARKIEGADVAVTGSLPSWIRGTLLLNGPALWELPGGRLEHWFDGYAMWHALRIGDAGLRYRSRFAQSESFRRSSSAGMPAYGEFGTANPASLMTRLRALQATDNPAVVMSQHGNRWCSVTETPHLTYSDPDTANAGANGREPPGRAHAPDGSARVHTSRRQLSQCRHPVKRLTPDAAKGVANAHPVQSSRSSS
jgi:beta,beta-carotene 9',10'-dioxygenase